MLKQQRYEKILEILDADGYATASDLSRKLFVSMPTIRRDLSDMHRQNLILRSHGGAKKLDSEHTVLPLDFRKTQNRSEKRRLCAYASSMIEDGNIIFVDASSTVLQMSDFIPRKKSVTVITNGFAIASLLVQKGVKTFCTGGEIQPTSFAFAGSQAEAFIKNFNIDIMFFSSAGISRKGYITDSSLAETSLRKTAMALSSKTVFLCDSSKIFTEAPYNLDSVSNISSVITDSAALMESEFADTGKIIKV